MRVLECKGVLFDLDGVLVDSARVVVRTWHTWARTKGLDAERFIEIAHGRRPAETLHIIAPELDAEAEAAELERIEANDTDGILEVEGALELLGSLPDDGWTVVTSGSRALASGRMRHVGLPLPERFVTADDVENGKPHPEAYLKGAEILGASPDTCIVIEDAPAGVQSAKAAGMRVVAVATTNREEDLHEADVVVGALSDVRVLPQDAAGVNRPTRLRLIA
ncbi:MAG: Putative phosphatase YfbT, partial [uncultured Rubrobacteraceae bacterium]